MNKTIYVLHEFGMPSHYLALQQLAKRHGCKVRFREMHSFRSLRKRPGMWGKYIVNRIFWHFAPLMPKFRIVVAIAPFNLEVKKVMRQFAKHDVYYHTSYSRWDGSMSAHRLKGAEYMDIWREFTKTFCKHIFAVSQKTKDELIANGFASADKISIVNHSYPNRIEAEEHRVKRNTFIQVANLTANKGTEQLLDYFAKHPEYELNLAGKGDLLPMVQNYAAEFTNIHYLGYISDFTQLSAEYKKNSFLILNSQRSEKWEELFGMAVIEGMACGCVPVTTDHPGPMEIIDNGINGIICKEGDIAEGIEKCARMTDREYQEMRSKAILRGAGFYCETMAEKWKKIME